MTDITAKLAGGTEGVLPCPFCGGHPRICRSLDESLWSHAEVLKTSVRCDDCDIATAYTEEGEETEAIERWNRRAALAAAPAAEQGEDVREQLKAWAKKLQQFGQPEVIGYQDSTGKIHPIGEIEKAEQAVPDGCGGEQCTGSEHHPLCLHHASAPGANALDSVPDPILPKARLVVVGTRRASISTVQRHLRIGYNRAARLLEALEAQGVVSAQGDKGQRTVLVT